MDFCKGGMENLEEKGGFDKLNHHATLPRFHHFEGFQRLLVSGLYFVGLLYAHLPTQTIILNF